MIRDPDFDERRAVAVVKMLGYIGSEEAVQCLIELLRDPGLKWFAVTALGKNGSEEAVLALTELLKDRNFKPNFDT